MTREAQGQLPAYRHPPLIQRAFEQWKAQSPDPSADSLVFPSVRTGRPMWPGLFLQKRIQPIAKCLGITVPVTFQVLRRSCGTRNPENGSLKDLRHELRFRPGWLFFWSWVPLRRNDRNHVRRSAHPAAMTSSTSNKTVSTSFNHLQGRSQDAAIHSRPSLRNTASAFC